MRVPVPVLNPTRPSTRAVRYASLMARGSRRDAREEGLHVTWVGARSSARGATPARVRLRFEGRQELAGVVVDSRGQPLPEIYVGLESPLRVQSVECGSPPRGVRTGPDGRFTFRQLSGEQLMLIVGGGNYALSPSLSKSDRFPVKPGTKELRVVLVRRASIQGRLLQTDGEPITSFHLNGVEQSNEDGGFSWGFVQTGMRELEFSAPGFKPVRRTVSSRKGWTWSWGRSPSCPSASLAERESRRERSPGTPSDPGPSAPPG